MSVKKILVAIIFLSVVVTASAQRNYSKEWKRIDSLIQKTGLIKTALKDVNAIYAGAKKEGNDVQVIKALVYRMQLNDQLSDSGRYENIALLEKEISSTKEPAKSVLHSIAGGSYWSYLQMNRWQFYQRSNTRGYDSKDISTWSLEQLYNRITSHFDKSISNTKALQVLKLDKFEPIIIKGNVRYLRPTLFDLLAFRALDYYRNDERYITKPAYAFEISDSLAFSAAETFIKHLFKTNDTLSLHHRALEVYQQLLSFHINDVKHDALIDADLDRLNFVRNFSTHADKEELYQDALQQLVNKFSHDSAITSALYSLASLYYEKGSRFDPNGDTSNRYSIVTAKELCEKAIGMNAKNEGSANCKNLLHSILRHEIRMQVEQVNPTGEPFRMLVQYKNAGNAYVRIVKYDRNVRERVGVNEWEDRFWNNVVALPVVKGYSYPLPVTDDYQLHRVEVKIDSLPAGEYGILVSCDKNFALAKNAMAFTQVYVSDISYVNNNRSYYVLNRKTGVPLSKAKVQIWETYYNQSRQKQDIRKLEMYSTSDDGYFELKREAAGNGNTNILLDISTGSDRLFIDRPIYNYVYDGAQGKDTITTQTALFTDRSIYRPGQTVYFKGIVISRSAGTSNATIVPDHKSRIFLHDANGQAVDSFTLVTNEFGSYSGKFVIPTGLITGEFSIMENETNSQATFRVEEYKRPKFVVKIEAPGGTYRLNDTINVEGSAVSYAGNNITGASVRYRVTRRAMIPYWMTDYSPRIWPPYPQEQMEIAHGSTTIDANGNFKIPFTAIPDHKIPRASHPVFYYTVTTDVTDINGETQSGNATVNVGYESMKMELDVPHRMHVDSLSNIYVLTTNMNDSFERARVHISMHKLASPEKTFRERYWEQPDQFVMTRDEYYKIFPYDQYDGELDKRKWQKQPALITDSFITEPGKNYLLNKKITDAGWYLLEAFTKDKFGDSVVAKKYLLLYNHKLVCPDAGAVLAADRIAVEPGEKVKYSMITNVGEARIIHELLRNNETKKEIGNTVGGIISVNESDRGGMVLKTIFVKHNRVYTELLNIHVPFTNKQLKIDYVTYRDKTLPGSGEKWKVKISGMKGDKISAELLTSMYDASLDQFIPHAWHFPSLWTSSLNSNSWNGNTNFNLQQSIQRNIFDKEEVFVKIYDQLLITEGNMLERQAFGTKVMARSAPAVKDAAVELPMANMEKSDTAQQTKNNAPSTQTRKNLNETAFFFPNLTTDADGNIGFSFTTPEALTTWNWLLLAHTKDLSHAYDTKKIITRKELMVQPNAPRFFREGDNINFSVKVANMSAKTISGTATLELFDPSTGKEVTGIINNAKQNFSAPAGQSIPLFFNVNIPVVYTQPLTWKVIATSEGVTDGEENIIPVLSNRMLVTESIALPVRNTRSKTFRFEKLINSGSSKSLTNKALTIEFTTNPAWYAVQALPYLSEVKDENAEQLFNRFYANALASKLANGFPKLKAVIEQWKSADTSAFLSNLQKNQDLKNIILEETPWVAEAKTESQRKKNIALLFDMKRMSNDLASALSKLVSMQSEDGSFVWYKGGPPDRFMTQYIVSGMGRLKKLDAIPAGAAAQINSFAEKAIRFLDQSIKKDYDLIKKNNKKVPGTYIAYEPVQYLYMRSFFTNIPVPASVTPAYNYFRNNVKQHWVKQNTFMRAMIALSLQRTGDVATAKKIIAALKESSIQNDELGMYWKDMSGGYYWYQAPVEAQSVLIEAFNEISHDDKAVADMKTWLLKNKQTNQWKTSKATADACYALLLEGGSWIEDDANVSISLGDKMVTADKTEAGSGYFRKTFEAGDIKPIMGNITVNLSNKNTRPAWGGLYWQYFEDLDKVTSASTPLSINKKLFVQKNTNRGPVIEVLDNNNTLHVGDRVKVRIEIRSDRSMEYVHLKDMRSSAMEPVNVLSEYRWQGGLGYYQSTRDASTNFFFSFLQKGTYVFEYDLLVTHAGRFSNGVAAIQCMYAPEFSSHTEGIKINVAK